MTTVIDPSVPRLGCGQTRRVALALALAAPLLAHLLAPPSAFAQAYPSRPITMVVPFPPGGPTDLVARVLAQKLGEQIGQTIVVENRAGAYGNIGAVAVAKAAATPCMFPTRAARRPTWTSPRARSSS